MFDTSNTSHEMVNDTAAPVMPKQEALSRQASVLCAVYLTILWFITVLGNSCIAMLFLKVRTLFKNVSNWLILNLAIADAGIAIFGFPFVIVSSYVNRWFFNDAVCQMYAFNTFWFSMVSYYTLCALSVYRYIHLCQPLYKKHLTKKNTAVVVAVAWLSGLIWPLMPFFGWGHYGPEEFGNSCSLTWTRQTLNDISLNISTTIFCFVLPLVIMIYCYAKVHNEIRFTNTEEQLRRFGTLSGLQTAKRKNEWKVLIMCGCMVCGFVLTWGPYAVISVLSGFYEIPLTATVLPLMFAKLAPSVNVILYSICNDRFRREVFKEWCCFLHKVGPTKEDPYVTARYKNTPVNSDLFFAPSIIDKKKALGTFVGISDVCVAVEEVTTPTATAQNITFVKSINQI